jgi:hypothetical protein
LTLDFQPIYVYINGESIKELEHLSVITTTQTNIASKRPVQNGGANSDDDESKKSKTMDIYKQRQYQKLKNTK